MLFPPLSNRNISETHIASALREVSSKSTSGGSYKEDWGPAALIVEGAEHKTHQIATSCTCPGLPKDQDAYRSELAGIFHVVSIVEEISQKFNILEGKITITCDGLNTIKKAMDIETRYPCLSNKFNLISAIDHNILNSPLTW